MSSSFFLACRQFVLFVCLQGKTWVSMFLFFSLHLLHTWSQQMRLLTKPGSGGGHWLLKDSCSIQVFDHICRVIWNLFTWLLDCISLKIMTCAFLCKFTAVCWTNRLSIICCQKQSKIVFLFFYLVIQENAYKRSCHVRRRNSHVLIWWFVIVILLLVRSESLTRHEEIKFTKNKALGAPDCCRY